jgi:hypothetical protein
LIFVWFDQRGLGVGVGLGLGLGFGFGFGFGLDLFERDILSLAYLMG